MRRDCARCEREVEAEYDDPKLRRWVKGYFWLGVPFIPLSPIIGADYVVMGGFGHGRLVEAVFGGVSREMLSRSPIPLVIAH